eukprot:6889339-Prymnesium_polylepis.2
MASLTVSGVRFVKKKAPGDFEAMYRRAEYGGTLLIIAENFFDSLFNTDSGGGTAVMRPQTLQVLDPEWKGTIRP